MSVPTQRNPDSGPDTAVQVVLARLEGKVDVALAQHGAKLDNHAGEIADHEARLRAVEARPIAPADHETRIRVVETTPTVSPKTLWAAVIGAGGLLAALAPFVERIYS